MQKMGTSRRGACGRRARHGRGPRPQGTAGVGLSRHHPGRGARLADRDRGTVRLRPYVSAARAHRTDEAHRGSGHRRRFQTPPAHGGRAPRQRAGQRGRGDGPGAGPDRRRAPARTGPAPAPVRGLAARGAAPPGRALARGAAAGGRGARRRRARPGVAAQGLADGRARPGAGAGAAPVRRAGPRRPAPAAGRGRPRHEAVGRRTRRGVGHAALPRARRYDGPGGVPHRPRGLRHRPHGPRRRPGRRRAAGPQGGRRCARLGWPPSNCGASDAGSCPAPPSSPCSCSRCSTAPCTCGPSGTPTAAWTASRWPWSTTTRGPRRTAGGSPRATTSSPGCATAAASTGTRSATPRPARASRTARTTCR
ncbi:hypothetical protein SGPA1_31224 [Streptomyces misionensis JCM 4497]